MGPVRKRGARSSSSGASGTRGEPCEIGSAATRCAWSRGVHHSCRWRTTARRVLHGLSRASPRGRMWLRAYDCSFGLAPDRTEHLATYQSAPWAHDQPVRAEAGARILRAPHASLRRQLGGSARARRDGEVPAGERHAFRWSGAEILHADIGAQLATRCPELAEQTDDELLRRTLGDDAEPSALEVRQAKPASTRRPELPTLTQL